MTTIPFQPPLDPTPPPIPGAIPIAPPNYALHDPTSVGIATFLGSPIAGTILMAINYRRLGKASAGVGAILLGVLAAVAPLALGFVIKSGSFSSAILIGLLVATVALARQLQGPEIELHRARGGKVASRWVGAGIGLLIGVVILGGLLAYVLLFDQPFKGTRLAVGAHDEIYYSGSATEAEARALGDVLTKAEFFGKNGATVQFDKSGGKTTISLVVKDGAWDKPDFITGVKDLAADIAPAVGGLPVTVKLLDAEGESHKEVFVTEPRQKNWTIQ